MKIFNVAVYCILRIRTVSKLCYQVVFISLVGFFFIIVFCDSFVVNNAWNGL